MRIKKKKISISVYVLKYCYYIIFSRKLEQMEEKYKANDTEM